MQETELFYKAFRHLLLEIGNAIYIHFNIRIELV